MMDWRDAYAERQRRFWNVATRDEARFARVITGLRDPERDWKASAAADAARVFAGISPASEWTILDFACGAGRVLSHVSKHYQFARLIGVDIAEQMLAFARQEVGDDPRIDLLVNSGYDLSVVGTGSVDFGYGLHVFIHIFDRGIAEVYLQEIHRVLKPGALFRFNLRRYDDSAFAITAGGLLARLRTRLGFDSPGRHRWDPEQDAEFNGNQYTRKDIHALVDASGLQLIDLERAASWWWLTVARPSS
jgi:SAM-dependent methyltransferase